MIALQGLVSVVIPCYNAERYIGDSIESALEEKQTSNVEVIVIDDGSSDGSRNVIDGFGQEIKKLYQDNQGVSSARNAGTKMTTGEYIQYLDADDLLCAGTLKERVQVMEENTADVCYTDWRKIEEEGADSGAGKVSEICRTIEEVNSDPQIAIFTDFWAPPAAILYRRELVQKIRGWRSSLPVIQDARFLWDAAYCGARFVHLPRFGAMYRVHAEGSLSSRSRLAFARDVYRNAVQIEKLWRSEGDLDGGRTPALLKAYNYVSREFLLTDYRRFRSCVKRIYDLEPHFRFSWPKLASALSRMVGNQYAADLMGSLGRPASR